MNRKNLLYLNLSVDEKDVSLGFAKTWTDQFSKNFDNVDIITLNKPVENIEYHQKPATAVYFEEVTKHVEIMRLERKVI